ncbi:MAG: aldo/keto reductase [Deltaproteobacteria bacterium]|nr:MAG: aldo/keto reductase [Deltaproteobacteria bacterium]
MPETDFLHATLPVIDKPVHRLGIAGNYGIDAAGMKVALDELGLQYIYWTPRMRKVTPAVVEALGRDRDRYVLATGPTTGFWGGNIRRFVESTLRRLRTDYLDVLQLHWLGVTSWWTDGTVSAMMALREEGKVRALGISIHDRQRAGQLVADSPLDLLMIRYNAAHPGAERDIFPHNPPGDRRKAIVSYTATAWRKLLRRPRGWTDRIPDAGDCYRFVLSSPHVDVCLTGPRNLDQLRANVAALDRGPLSPEEDAWMRRFGEVVHG